MQAGGDGIALFFKTAFLGIPFYTLRTTRMVWGILVKREIFVAEIFFSVTVHNNKYQFKERYYYFE